MQFSFGGLKKAAVKPAAPKQSTSNAGFGCGFGDNDSDSDSADGKKRMGVEMKEQSERNKREAEVIRKECADVFAAFEQDAPDAPDTATTSLETDAPPAPLKFKKTSRFIASMKQSAIQREQDREHTDIRIIRDQAQKTDHLYTEVDAAVAPINTIEYTKKLKEQEEAAMRAADTKEFEKQNAVEKVGMMGFGMSFVESQMKRGDDEKVEDPEEETQRQLEIFLHKKEQKRKKERRAKYLAMKAQQEADLLAEAEAEEAAAEAEEAAAEAAAAAAAAGPAPTPPPEDATAPEMAPTADGPTPTADAAGDEEEASTEGAPSGQQEAKRLAVKESERRALVHERRLKRLRKRNTPEDVERVRERFLRRKVALEVGA